MPRSTRSKDAPKETNTPKKDKPKKDPPSLSHMAQLISKVQRESATMKANMLKVSQQLDLVQSHISPASPVSPVDTLSAKLCVSLFYSRT